MKRIHSEHPQQPHMPPRSYISWLAEMGVQSSECSLIQSKAGISVYRVSAERKSFILKIYENPEDAREIQNYLVLSKLGIPTLPLLNYAESAILLPDINASDDYRLGQKSDLSDARVAKAIAKWYRELHEKSAVYLSGEEGRRAALYDETDLLTPENLREIARRTGTVHLALWQIVSDSRDEIRRRLRALPKALTYNDFYYTNLIVAKDYSRAFMFDFNLMGKGYPYSDIRNVTSSLSMDAAAVFIREYGDVLDEEQKRADAFISPLVALVHACKRETFPSWARSSLEELKNGEILRNLQTWLRLK